MKYGEITEGIFLSRPNRFIAKVRIDGKEETVHVKNTGRCRELLIPGSKVYLYVSDNPKRKTEFDLIAVEKQRDGKNTLLINMDSQAPNTAAEEYLKSGKLFSKDAVIKREVKYKNSRFDFYIEDGKRKIFLEVKGATLENDGVVSFPDAPTERGVKHINELVSSIEEGFEAYILFVIQMKGIKYMTPNDVTHPDFGKALRNAHNKGVNVFAVDCEVLPDSMVCDSLIEVKL